MEWSKAKYFVIVLLIALNAGLAALNYRKNQEQTLTPSQERAVFEVLSKNGISLYTELISDFPPMRRVALHAKPYSRDDMKNLYFPNEDTTVTMEFNRMIIKSDWKTLTMEGNRGLLEFSNGDMDIPEGLAAQDGLAEDGQDESDLSAGQAQKMASDFINGLSLKGRFTMGKTIPTPDGYIVEYFEKYKGQTLFASFYRIRVTANGICRVAFTHFEPVGFTGEKKEICFSDEALLTFLMEWRKVDRGQPATITAMEIGYDFQEANVTESTDNLVPVYRIYVMGEEIPVVINAYTNEIISGGKS